MRKLIYLLAILALVAAACGGSEDSDATTTTAATAAAGQNDSTETTAATESTAATDTDDATTTSSAGTAVSDSPLLAALAQSSQATSGRMEGSMVVTGSEGMAPGTEFAIEFSGEFDNATGNSSMIMDMSGLADAAPAGEEIPAGFEDFFGEMEIRTIGDVSYMKFGMFAMLGVPTEWVRMSADDAGTAAGSFGASPINPTEMMDAFSNENAQIVDLGSEQVRGVNTTHYRITMDIEAMLEDADADSIEELENLGPLPANGELPVDFWIGDDGNVYRMLLEIVGADVAESGFVSMRMMWEMFDYGANIEIVAPPEDDVTDGDALTGFLTG
jgi:hypothetical protein